MERAIEAAATAGGRVSSEFAFDALYLDVVHIDGPQGGAQLAVEATGLVRRPLWIRRRRGRSLREIRTRFVLNVAGDDG